MTSWHIPMGCNGYTIAFFYRAVFPTGKRFIPKDTMLGNKYKRNRLYVGMFRR